MFGDRIDPATITLNGVVLDPATSYRIAVEAGARQRLHARRDVVVPSAPGDRLRCRRRCPRRRLGSGAVAWRTTDPRVAEFVRVGLTDLRLPTLRDPLAPSDLVAAAGTP